MSPTRLLAIVVKELRQLSRDRLTFGMILGIPAIQLLLFGFAINMDIRNIDTAFVDEARTAHSREIIATLEATGLITPRDPVRTPGELQELIRKGRINIGIVIPADLEKRLATRDRRSRDFTLATLRRALGETITAFPVYRTYVRPDGTRE